MTRVRAVGFYGHMIVTFFNILLCWSFLMSSCASMFERMLNPHWSTLGRRDLRRITTLGKDHFRSLLVLRSLKLLLNLPTALYLYVFPTYIAIILVNVYSHWSRELSSGSSNEDDACFLFGKMDLLELFSSRLIGLLYVAVRDGIISTVFVKMLMNNSIVTSVSEKKNLCSSFLFLDIMNFNLFFGTIIKQRLQYLEI